MLAPRLAGGYSQTQVRPLNLCKQCGEQKSPENSLPGRNLCKPCHASNQRALRLGRKTGQRPYLIKVDKTCSACAVTQSVAEFYKEATSADGFGKTCKACDEERKRKLSQDRKSGVKPYKKVNTKVCWKCSTEKLVSDFYKNASTADQHSPTCKECEKEINRFLYATNDLRKFKQLTRTRIGPALKRVGSKERGVLRHMDFTPSELLAHLNQRLDTCNYVCPMCQVSDLHKGFDIDHIIPLSTAKTKDEVIRLSSLNNLDVLCPDCNRKVKRDRLVWPGSKERK